jgi:hypothetical protein
MKKYMISHSKHRLVEWSYQVCFLTFFINCCFLSVVSKFHQLLTTNNQQIVKYATGLDISGQLIIQLAISKQ